MAHNVFISHSSKDSEIAQMVCATLEEWGIKCWMAPRDIAGGEDWDEALLDGIDGSEVVVLVFSSNANSSRHVRRELHHALEGNKKVIPLRIEAVAPARPLEY